MLTRKLFFITTTYILLYAVHGHQESKSNEQIQFEKDYEFIKKSITKFGAPQPKENYDLPGSEVVDNKRIPENIFIPQVENVTYKYYSNSKDFSYTEFYENIQIQINGTKKIITVKGQVTEKTLINNDSYYLTTVGYMFDGVRFQTFLLDISKVEISRKQTEKAKSDRIYQSFRILIGGNPIG